MKFFLFLLLFLTPVFSAMIPIYPEFADKPDSAHVISTSNGTTLYTVKYGYTSEGFLDSETYFYEGTQSGYSKCHYQKTGDTIKCTYTISEEPDNQYVDLYILDNSGKIVKYMGYDATVLYDEQMIVYNQDNKIAKTVTSTASLAEEMGDSTVYRYDSGKIKKVDIYGNGGSNWSYSDYETDNLGRVIKSMEYDCENDCVADTEYVVYFFGNTRVLYPNTKTVPAAVLDLSKSKGIISITMRSGTSLLYADLFDLIGNRIKRVNSSDRKSLSLSTKNITGQKAILQLQTSKGVVKTPIVIME